MDTFYKEIQAVVLGKTAGWNFGDTLMDGAMVELFCAIDGRENIAELKNDLDLTEAQVCKSVNRLLELGLVRKIAVKQSQPAGVTTHKGIYRGVPFEIK